MIEFKAIDFVGMKVQEDYETIQELFKNLYLDKIENYIYNQTDEIHYNSEKIIDHLVDDIPLYFVNENDIIVNEFDPFYSEYFVDNKTINLEKYIDRCLNNPSYYLESDSWSDGYFDTYESEIKMGWM